MNKNNLISIIIPAYNIENYISRCLESVLCQTYKNLEIIVVSDGSIDNTNNIISEYAAKDSRIVPIFKDNSGVSDTRNKALEIAKGDYIGFIDGDDYIEPDMYEILLNNLLENDADISHCGYQMVFPSRVDYYYNTGKKIIQDNRKGVQDIIVGDYVEPGLWNKLFKREVVEGLRFETQLLENEDFLYNVLAFINSKKSVYEDKPLYHYILRKNSACTSSFNIKKTDNQIYVIDKIYNLFRNDELEGVVYNRYINTLCGAYRTTCLERTPNEAYREKLRTLYDKKHKDIISSKKKMEINLILKASHIYKILMFIYKKLLYKNPYEVE